MVEEPVQGAIDEDGTEVDRDVQRLLGRGQIRSGGAAERPYEITTSKPDGREWTARPPFGRDHLDRGGAVVDDDEVGGRSARSPQSVPFSTLMVSAPNGKGYDAAMDGIAGVAGALAVAGSVAFAASCPSRSVSCLMLRTKSPAVISSLRPSNTPSDSPLPSCGPRERTPGRVIESRPRRHVVRPVDRLRQHFQLAEALHGGR